MREELKIKESRAYCEYLRSDDVKPGPELPENLLSY